MMNLEHQPRAADPVVEVLFITYRVLSTETSFLFRRDLVEALQSEPRFLIIDLSAVRYMDSSCIGVLMMASRMVPGRIRLMIAGARGVVRDVCVTSRIGRLIPLYESVEEAREAALRPRDEIC